MVTHLAHDGGVRTGDGGRVGDVDAEVVVFQILGPPDCLTRGDARLLKHLQMGIAVRRNGHALQVPGGLYNRLER